MLWCVPLFFCSRRGVLELRYRQVLGCWGSGMHVMPRRHLLGHNWGIGVHILQNRRVLG
jgi:hypothetical protein